MEFGFLELNTFLASRLDILWTFFLLVFRYSGMMMALPGIGNGPTGLRIRGTAILMFAMATCFSSPLAPPPEDVPIMIFQGLSEVMLGLILGIIPAMLVAGVQTAATLSSTTMGLGAAQLVDPTFGGQVTSLARLFGDLTIILFLLSGGHYVVIYAVSGLSSNMIPGTFLITDTTISTLIDRSADIFRVATLISAPVIVALLLTQFVMGLITKAVPSVNIFIVSFPLTIGIGLVLSALSLPEMLVFLQKEINGFENSLAVLLGS